jgi:hypothetical protein
MLGLVGLECAFNQTVRFTLSQVVSGVLRFLSACAQVALTVVGLWLRICQPRTKPLVTKRVLAPNSREHSDGFERLFAR